MMEDTQDPQDATPAETEVQNPAEETETPAVTEVQTPATPVASPPEPSFMDARQAAAKVFTDALIREQAAKDHMGEIETAEASAESHLSTIQVAKQRQVMVIERRETESLDAAVASRTILDQYIASRNG